MPGRLSPETAHDLLRETLSRITPGIHAVPTGALIHASQTGLPGTDCRVTAAAYKAETPHLALRQIANSI